MSVSDVDPYIIIKLRDSVSKIFLYLFAGEKSKTTCTGPGM
jgi:hypothetical protein